MRTTVAVSVITYRRPEGLTKLLASLAQLDVDGVEPPIVPVVVVVDNDPDGSARAVVEQAELPWPVRYALEAERGIPFARNRAVAEATGCDFLAFIDDDETPDPNWLRNLVECQRRTNADVVTGPVLPRFEQPPSPWVEAGAFFDRPRFATDETIPWATTSSVLVSLALFDRYPKPFNERMRHTGGTDTHFFMRAHGDGARIAWADDAVVTETFPASRVNARWLLTREYRRGNTMSLSVCDLDPSWYRKARQLASAGYKIARGVASMLVGGVRDGRIGVLRGALLVCLGAGVATGVLGVRYEEYRTLHGR